MCQRWHSHRLMSMIDAHQFVTHAGVMPARHPALALVGTTPCCAPLHDTALSQDEAVELSRRLKALADPARLRVISLLMTAPDGEACTCDLTGPLGLSQPTVSHHLKRLAQAGLVTGERRGVWTYYRVDPDALSAAVSVLAPRAR
jgi:ArsR family transcriptional regulator, arsenate/arsenite/antimonite-responsive transcriptional repressor